MDPIMLKALVKEAVKEALQEWSQQPTKADVPQQPSYEETFHKVMADVARGALSAQDAGKLLADAYQRSQQPAPPSEGPKQPEMPQDAPFSSRVAGWEDDFSRFNAQQTENTLQMLDRMKAKLQARIDEADFHREMKKISAEEAKAKAAADLQALKDKMKKQ